MEKKITLLLIVIMSFSYANGSITLQDEEHPLSVYPNPAFQYVNVKLLADQSETPQIQILDLTGKVVFRYEKDISKDQDFYFASMDISRLRPGVYFVKVVRGDQTFSEKLVLK